MIKPFLVLLFIILFIVPFIYLGYKSLDVSVDRKRRGHSSYIIKEYPVFLMGCVFFGIAGILVANIKDLWGFL